MKRTTTQWTTTTTRSTTAPKGMACTDADMAELTEYIERAGWVKMIGRVDKMPLDLAMQLRDKLNKAFGG